MTPPALPDHLVTPEIVRDGNLIGPGVRFWHRTLGTCTALEAPDEHGQFRATYVQYLSDGTRQDVPATHFHVGMVAR
jgi:hypothetical protein